MAYIQSYKDQVRLLPPSIEELIPDDHICFLVEALIDSMDFKAFDFKYAGAGHPAYHPRVLLKILVMGGYGPGTFLTPAREERMGKCCLHVFIREVISGFQDDKRL